MMMPPRKTRSDPEATQPIQDNNSSLEHRVVGLKFGTTLLVDLQATIVNRTDHDENYGGQRGSNQVFPVTADLYRQNVVSFHE